MIEAASVLLSLAFSFTGPLCVVNGYRIYSPEQRASANRLWRVYVAGSLLVGVVGPCSLVWIVTRGSPSVWLFAALTGVPLPVTLVQWRMHKRMEYTGRGDAWLVDRVS